MNNPIETKLRYLALFLSLFIHCLLLLFIFPSEPEELFYTSKLYHIPVSIQQTSKPVIPKKSVSKSQLKKQKKSAKKTSAPSKKTTPPPSSPKKAPPSTASKPPPKSVQKSKKGTQAPVAKPIQAPPSKTVTTQTSAVTPPVETPAEESSSIQPPSPFPGDSDNPSLLISREPVFPKQALNLGLSGQVSVDFTINTKGMITSYNIVESSGYRILDLSFIRSVEREWTFNPKQVQGKPTEGVIRLEHEY